MFPIGWAEPEKILSAPRTQHLPGFSYFYTETKNVTTAEFGKRLDEIVGSVQAAYQEGVGTLAFQPLLVFTIDVDSPDREDRYDIQAGYAVPSGTAPCGEAQVREVAPALVASMLAWGKVPEIWPCYQTLIDYIEAEGYACITGWREYYLYREDDSSKNSVTWVMHEVKPKEQA